MNVLNYNDEDNLNDIVVTLKKGGLVVYPTDTIYGIAANINDTQAIKKVYITKKRAHTKAISICFHDMSQLDEYVSISDTHREILDKVLPGPYTFLLKAKNNINPLLTAYTNTVGIRIPDNTVSYKLTSEFPITSTSANISDLPTPDNITEIKQQLKDNITTYIDIGRLKNNQASTIVDLTTQNPKIVRQGASDERVLKKILKINL